MLSVSKKSGLLAFSARTHFPRAFSAGETELYSDFIWRVSEPLKRIFDGLEWLPRF